MGKSSFLYTERNGYRMPPYNRLDLSATLQGKKTKKFESSWNFSIYNAYGRENPYSIGFQQDPGDPDKDTGRTVCVVPLGTLRYL